MEMKIIGVTITVFVSLVVLAAVLMPVLDDSTATEDTYTNEGWFRMSQYDATTNHVISWTYEKPNVITVDGEDVVIGYNVKDGSCTVVANSIWLLRYKVDSNGNTENVGFLYGTSGTKLATVADHQTATLTLTAGSASVSVGNYTGTHSYDVVYVPDTDGDYTMKKSDETAYINGDSPIYGFGLTRIRSNSGSLISSPGNGFAFAGTYDDGITGSVWRGDTTTVSDCVCVATVDSSHEDLYKFDKITAVATLTETVDDETVTTDTDLTYNMVIVPYEVTAERTVHFTPNENAIFAAIPLLIIVAILIGVLAVVIRSKSE